MQGRDWPRLLREHPLTGAVAIMAIVLSVAWWLNDGLDWLALDYGPVADQPLQLFTSALLHVNVVHLIFNCWWLMVLGTWIETRHGWLRTLALLLLWSAVPALAELATFDGGVGLSGVVYAQWAYLAVLRCRGIEPDVPVGRDEDLLMIAWFFLCIFMTATDMMPVGNVAHGVGGLLGGACALVHTRHATAGWAAAAALTALGIAGATIWRPIINFSSNYTQQLAYEAWHHDDREEHVEAEQKWRAAASRAAHVADYQLGLAKSLWLLDRRVEAEQVIRDSLARWPDDEAVREVGAWWHATCGREAIDVEDYEAGIQHYLACTTLRPQSATYWFHLGICHDNLQDIPSAKAAYERTVRIDRRHERAAQRLRELAK